MNIVWNQAAAQRRDLIGGGVGHGEMFVWLLCSKLLVMEKSTQEEPRAVGVALRDSCVAVSRTFCYGVCSPGKPLVADVEASRHSARAGTDACHVAASAERCLGPTWRIGACVTGAVECWSPVHAGDLCGANCP